MNTRICVDLEGKIFLWHLTKNREDGWGAVKPVFRTPVLEAAHIFEGKPLHKLSS